MCISRALFGGPRSAVPPPSKAAASQQQGSNSRRLASRVVAPITIFSFLAILTRSTGVC